MADSENEGATKSGGGFLPGLIVATVIAGGAGAGFGSKVDLPVPKLHEQAKVEEPPPQVDPNLTDKKRIVRMAPLLANLAAPANTLVRIEASLLMDLDTEHQSALAAEIGDDIVAYLRTVSVDELQGPSGFQFLKEDLADRVRTRGKGKVHDILFSGFSVE